MPTSPAPERTVSAAEANRGFSRLLREVQAGQSFVVTSHGRPVARLAPLEDDAETRKAEREAAREALWTRLRTQAPLEIESWTRDELHER